METKMTVIVDNVPYGELAGEWGLSILVEYDGKKILVDAGASPLFAGNMEKLGLDMADVDYAVLSHAHFDHANGMPRLLSGQQQSEILRAAERAGGLLRQMAVLPPIYRDAPPRFGGLPRQDRAGQREI